MPFSNADRQEARVVRESSEMPPSLKVVPTIYPTSPPLEELLDRFWQPSSALKEVQVDIAPPEEPLAILEQLGPSPFPRGRFPLIGFLATTYDKVSRFAQERA
jgi:uncharacterized Zn finger protein